MWRESERKLHMKIIAIGKSLGDDMMDSDTTGKEKKQHFCFTYNISYLKY